MTIEEKKKVVDNHCSDHDCCNCCVYEDDVGRRICCTKTNTTPADYEILYRIIEKSEIPVFVPDENEPKQSEKTQKHAQICYKLKKIYEAKNHDYGDSFGEGFREYGMIMPVIRLEDKLRRLKTLVKTDAEVKDESVIDTLMDLANYAIMTVIEMEGK